MDFEPWTKYPSLTRDRLMTIGRLLRRVRSDTAELHEPSAGDNGWSLGCRAYARSCFVIRKAAGDYTWLRIIPESSDHQFTFAIGDVPIRFYHGDASETPSKYSVATFGELRQQKLALDLGVPISEILRIAIETDSQGKPTIITLVEMGEDNQPKNAYEIPSDEGKVIPLQAPAIDLPPAKVAPKQPKKNIQPKRDRDVG